MWKKDSVEEQMLPSGVSLRINGVTGLQATSKNKELELYIKFQKG